MPYYMLIYHKIVKEPSAMYAQVLSVREAQKFLIHAYQMSGFKEALGRTEGVEEKLVLIREMIFRERGSKDIDRALLEVLKKIDLLKYGKQVITRDNIFSIVQQQVCHYIVNSDHIIVRAFLADVFLKLAEERLNCFLGWKHWIGINICGEDSHKDLPQIGVVLPKSSSRDLYPRGILLVPTMFGFGRCPHDPMAQTKLFGYQFPIAHKCVCEKKVHMAMRRISSHTATNLP